MNENYIWRPLREMEEYGKLVCVFVYAFYKEIQETWPPGIVEVYSASLSVRDECDGYQLLNERLKNVFLISSIV